MIPEPNSPSALLARAQALLDARRPEDAADVLRRAIAATPGSPRALCLLSLALLQSRQSQEALAVADDAVAAAPAWDWPHRLRALALIRLKHGPEALSAARQAVAVSPGVPEAYLVLTDAHLGLGRIGDAREAAEKARELAPERTGGHVALSMVELRARHWTRAEAHARAALAIDPENASALNNLGVALRGLGRRREAVHYLGAASRLDPRDPLYRRNAVQAASRYGSIVLVVLVGLQFAVGNVVGGLFFGAALVVSRFVIMAMHGNLSGVWRTPLERWRHRHVPRTDPKASPELMRALRRERRPADRFWRARRR